MSQAQQAIYDQTLDLLDDIRAKAWLAEGMTDHGKSDDSWTFWGRLENKQPRPNKIGPESDQTRGRFYGANAQNKPPGKVGAERFN
jgi:hypothetical protein